MKKIFFRISLLSLALLIPFSCNENFLDTKPLGAVSSGTTWTDGALSQAFVFKVYSYLGYGGYEEQQLAAYTDEAMFTHSGRQINTFTEGTETPSTLAWMSGTYEWSSMYRAIRHANIAITNLPGATFTDDVLKERLLGEAHFLRAYYYHQLLRFYGGVPIIDKVYDLTDDFMIARNTYEECVDFILSDLELAITKLEGKDITDGRATDLAAKALKARVLLYAASDLHDATKASANSTEINGYTNKALLAYTSGSQAARWQVAKDAAKAVLDVSTGYKMNLSSPVSAEEGEANYVAIAMGGKSAVADASAAVELIFQKTQNALYEPENNWPLGGLRVGTNNGPNGYHCWAGNTPIQQLVDDYEMMDGSTFDWGNPTHASAPYENRDPRFYATVLYDGAGWKPRPDDVKGYDPKNQIQSGYYDNGNGGVINGVDTRESVIENWNGSRTGYYCRKFINPDPKQVDAADAQIIPWPFIRYTEVVLNYVEACIELGDETEARAWLNKIRFRAGMPATVATGTALRDLYRNERRIELVYEEHRYHDARRWMVPTTTVGRGIQSIQVNATLKVGQTAHSPYYYDPAVYDYTYTVEPNTSNETRTWRDKMYFRPISRNEININTSLVQNPGY